MLKHSHSMSHAMFSATNSQPQIRLEYSSSVAKGLYLDKKNWVGSVLQLIEIPPRLADLDES